MSKGSLPDGWRIVSLHYDNPNVPPHMSSRPSDRMIASADAIRVSYTPRGAREPIAYRTIHGASSRLQIGDLIDRVVSVASPV